MFVWTSSSHFTSLCSCCLKVISFYEPLKPFIAIVVEVVILVAAILLYEKSCSKKKPTEGSEDVKRRRCCWILPWTTTICLFLSENGISEQSNTLWVLLEKLLFKLRLCAAGLLFFNGFCLYVLVRTQGETNVADPSSSTRQRKVWRPTSSHPADPPLLELLKYSFHGDKMCVNVINCKPTQQYE